MLCCFQQVRDRKRLLSDSEEEEEVEDEEKGAVEGRAAARPSKKQVPIDGGWSFVHIACVCSTGVCVCVCVCVHARMQLIAVIVREMETVEW